MTKWDVRSEGEGPEEPVATVESGRDGRISVQVYRDPLTRSQAEELRLAIGAAVADVRAGDNRPAHDEGLRGSQRGEDHV